MLEDEEQNRDANREVEVEQGTKKAIDLFNSRFHYKATNSSWKRYDPGSL